MNTRVPVILATLLLSLALLTVTVVLAQEGDHDLEAEAAAESAAEEAKARAVESAAIASGAAPHGEITSLHVLTASLFVGVDEETVSTYMIDPATGNSVPEFTGFQVWGAAYDVAGERLFFNDGATLYEVLFDGGTPRMVGTIVSSETGTALVFVSLAHDGGALYGTRNIGTASNPEGLYEIDPLSLIATLITTYTLGGDAAELGGLAAHPTSGLIYATNDNNSVGLRGLVQVHQNGDLTLVAPYPAGETDIDGLAIDGDNRAYLLTDEPGNIYPFDFDTMTYTAPISNPWTTAALFAGAAWISTPAVALTKTVGTTPGVCASSNQIVVDVGTDVYYCYLMANTGSVALSLHEVHDSEIGAVVPGISITLEPGDSTAVIAPATMITSPITNTATYTAHNPGPVNVVTAMATATVNVNPAADIQVSPPGLSSTQRPETEVTLLLTIGNEGTADLEWTIATTTASLCEEDGDVPWASASPTSGTTAPGASSSVEVTFDSAGLSDGLHSGTLCVQSNDPLQPATPVPLTLIVESTTGVYLPVILKLAP